MRDPPVPAKRDSNKNGILFRQGDGFRCPAGRYLDSHRCRPLGHIKFNGISESDLGLGGYILLLKNFAAVYEDLNGVIRESFLKRNVQQAHTSRSGIPAQEALLPAPIPIEGSIIRPVCGIFNPFSMSFFLDYYIAVNY
jgi:hypothetical protein